LWPLDPVQPGEQQIARGCGCVDCFVAAAAIGVNAGEQPPMSLCNLGATSPSAKPKQGPGPSLLLGKFRSLPQGPWPGTKNKPNQQGGKQPIEDQFAHLWISLP